MRQTNAACSVSYKILRALLCVSVLLLCGIAPVRAEVSGLSLTVTPSGNVINSAGNVKLDAAWSSDSPPFTVTFKAKGSGIYSQSGVTDTNLSHTVPGSALAAGQNTFSVEVTDASGSTAPAVSETTVTVDNTPPSLTAILLTTDVITGSSKIRIQITSSGTPIKAPTVTCEGVTGTQEGSLTVGTSFIYTLQLNGFANGNHIINIKAKNLSEPESAAAEGTTTCSFTVGTNASGNTSIDGCSVTSPTNSTAITLTGTSPDGVNKLEILDNGSTLQEVSVTTSWNVSITLAEGEHSLIAVSKDITGAEISRSAAWPMTVDVTAPSTPSFETSSLPTTTDQTSITIPVSVEGYDSDLSAPIYIQALVNGSPVGAPIQVTSTSAGVTVPLSPGENTITFMATDSAGNTSANSSAFKITMKPPAPSELTVSSILIDTYSVPVPATVQLSAGSHQIAIYFSGEVDTSTNPTVTVEVARFSGLRPVVLGSWSDSKTYVGTFVLAQGVDGNVNITISGVKDAGGDEMPEYSQASSFVADTTPPTSNFGSMAPILISANSPSVVLSGTVTDSGSGVGYVELIYQNNSNLEIGTITVPIMAASPSPWNYQWSPSLPEGTYKLWVRAADQAKINPNLEEYASKTPRQLTIDLSLPTVSRVSLNDMTVDVSTLGNVYESINKIVAALEDVGGSGIDGAKTEISLRHDSGSIIPTNGPYPLDSNTMYVTFTPLTINGTYTIEVKPFDLAGNAGETASRSFVLNTELPDNFVTSPANGSVANETQEALAQSQVWATILDHDPDYTKSKISVKYNGTPVSTQVADAEKLIASIHGGALKKDQSHDGRYDVSVTCANSHSIGEPATTYFIYDSMPPIITSFSPHIDLKANAPVWIGKNVKQFSITVSDAPKDIIKHAPNMPTSGIEGGDNPFANPQVPGDSSWYNSSGSGVNAAASSFTAQIEGQEPVAGTMSGGTFYVARPNKTVENIENEAGAAVIHVSATIKDNADEGVTVPNVFTASYSYMFDYLEPEISVHASSNKNKYKSLLNVMAHVKDLGTSNEIRVASVKYCLDEGAWVELNSPSLPQKETSLPLSVPITSLPEGTHNLLFKAIDLAGNESETASFKFVVDRTGPVKPELVFPLSEQVIKTRSQIFRWKKVADADKYLLQVSDDSSFNNVINTITDKPDPALVGQLIEGLSGNASLTKDGTFYWRVAGIEELGDGCNIGRFSETRTFAVDTVKPKVLSVVPAPTSANKVASGMVTFTIRFDENMNVTSVPEVVLTSAGGEVMKVEQVSYNGDTWVGTTVIPKDNSAAYDGTAVISITEAADVAGNVMSEDSSHNIVIDTAPVFVAKIFTNPVNKYEIMIVVKASESLQGAPSCSVQQSTSKTPVVMNYLKDKFYAGAYTINTSEPGKSYIDVSGTDLYGVTGFTSIQFIVADITASKRLNIAANSGMATLKAAENAAFTDTSIFMIDREALDSPFAKDTAKSLRGSVNVEAVSEKTSSELVGVLPLEEIGPSSLRLKKCMLYTARFKDGQIPASQDKLKDGQITVPQDKLAVYRLQPNGSWVYQGGRLSGNAISAQLTGLGRLALMADMSAPTLSNSSIRNLERLKDEYPEISGEITDNGSGVDAGSFRLYINGLRVNGVSLDKNGGFSYKVKRPLPKGNHNISYEVLDRANNSLKKSIMVASPGPFQLNDFMPFPNPAKGNRVWFAYDFGQAPNAVSLKIYDAAGHKVMAFNETDFVPAASGKLNWNLRNLKGKRIANGVYFYKLKAVKNGKTLKKSGKLAVLN